MRHVLLLQQIVVLWSVARTTEAAEYGVDVSFPVHYPLTENATNPLGDRKAFYQNFMDGCRKHYGDKANRCDEYERDRLVMSRRQPQSMVVSCFNAVAAIVDCSSSR